MAEVEVEAVVGGLEARLAAVARAVEAVAPAVAPAAGAPTAAPTAARRPRVLGLESVCPPAATVCDGGCSPMWWRLQPYVVEAATLCGGGCNRIWQVCPLVASGQWLPDMRARAGGGADALGDAAGGAARLVEVSEVEACGAEAVVISCCGRDAAGAAAEVAAHLLGRPGVWALPALASHAVDNGGRTAL